MRDTLPTDADFVLASDQGQVVAGDREVIWALGGLDPGNKRLLLLEVSTSAETPADTLLANAATVQSDQTLAALSNTVNTLVEGGQHLLMAHGLCLACHSGDC